MYVPYLPGQSSPPSLPLGRFLPSLPANMVRQWCLDNLSPGNLVLDPFGFNPRLPAEIVSAGFPVLVTVNNPIHSFLIRTLASAPPKGELVAALQELAVSTRGDERMEAYIRSFYRVTCANCRQPTEAEAFLWRKDEEAPFAALVNCPACGNKGEQLLDAAALAGLMPLPAAQLHQARALNRIVSQDDPLRPEVIHALNAYPTRPLILIQTMINRLETLDQSPDRQRLLTALILSATDRGNTLWTYPSPRERPKQIVVPPVFVEKNLWMALEESIDLWTQTALAATVIDWQGQKDLEPAIYLFEGRLKELTPMPTDNSIDAVVTAFPRPNQAFWTLSALWTGWVWGREAVDPIRQVLSRQRYDWNWHTAALKGVLQVVHNLIRTEGKFWGLVTENEPMFLLSSLLSADATGWQLTQFAQSSDDQLAQCTFQVQKGIPRTVEPSGALAQARESIREYLQKNGEPANYDLIYTAAIADLAHRNKLAVDIFLENENQFASETNSLINLIFEESELLVRVGGGTASLDTGIWWLTDPSHCEEPLIDRLERHIVRQLIHQKTITLLALTQAVFEAFPGVQTPTREDILCCLESYGQPITPESQAWQLRTADQPAARKADLASMRALLHKIGQTLGFRVEGNDPLIWADGQGQNSPLFAFHIVASAIVKSHLSGVVPTETNPILVIPGSRSNLLAYKQQRDPLLKQQLDRGWSIARFRLIRDLEANPLLTRALFQEQIKADPPEYHASQLIMF